MKRLDRIYLVPALKEGRWNELAAHVEGKNATITPAMRQLFAKFLRRERKLPKHRPIGRNTEDRKSKIVTSVLELEYEGIGTEKAVSQVAVLAGVTPRTVRRALAEPFAAEFRRKVLESIGRLPPKLACRAKSGTAEFVDDYYVRLYLEVMVIQNKADNK